jgi:CRISPR-associated protein (TIGR02584 family)
MNEYEFPRRVLLAVTGLSPQVVTETLYALAVAGDPPWQPTEIHLITTAEGKRRAELALLSELPGWFHRLCRDLRLPEIAFDSDHIHCITGRDGRPLDDIRTPGDNEQAADYITEQVRRFTADESSALHVSIAGGRKTMGYYLGYALSLFGRPQDRLSHVLVSEPFESSWDFFYPTPYSQVIQTRDQNLADARDAEVTLAEIPFVSLRHGLDERLLAGGARFSEAVAAARRSLQPPRLTIDLAGQRIVAGEQEVPLPPAQLALYSLFARRALAGEPPLPAPPKEAPDAAWARRFLAEYRAIRSGALDDLERTEKALAQGMDGDYFSEKKSRLHRLLRRDLGAAAAPYLIDDGGTRPRRYALRLPPGAIQYRE